MAEVEVWVRVSVEGLRKKEPYDEEHRMRHKLQRWNLMVLPRWAATRALDRLNYLHKHAPPRVSAAALSTLWNRWTTARRFQFFSPCCLGCSDTAADSIEHYAHCPLVRRAAETELRLQLREWPHALGDFMLVTRPTSLQRPPRDTRTDPAPYGPSDSCSIPGHQRSSP